MLGRRHEDGYTGEVGDTAYVIPVGVREENGSKEFTVVPRRIELVGGRP
jgi:hypothetical protein